MEIKDPLYQAMTRDPMVLGVSLDCFILEIIVGSIAFLVLRSFWIAGGMVLLHLLCFWKCLDDVDYFSIGWTAFSMTGKGQNRPIWEGVSYDPD